MRRVDSESEQLQGTISDGKCEKANSHVIDSKGWSNEQKEFSTVGTMGFNATQEQMPNATRENGQEEGRRSWSRITGIK